MMNTTSITPTKTPVRQTKANRKLPMIVDIAIDNNGKQLYQVHESSKLVRKEMPKSTSFTNTNASLVTDASTSSTAAITGLSSYTSHDEERTPIRRILGTISPSTLNQKKLSDSDNEDFHRDHPESATRKSAPPMFDSDKYDQYTTLDTGRSLTEAIAGSGETDYQQLSYPSQQQEKDIWSKDVETAFEEVLSIIPKNGLNKIKISGRLCGRNELISDYILTKTGKFRTRKQVSSHIQVIKNLGQKQDIIKLINDGPVYKSQEDQDLSIKRFEEIFSKINLNKSLGLNDASSSSSTCGPSVMKRKSPHIGGFSKKPKVAQPLVCIENFFISIQDSMAFNPVILSLQDNDEVKTLKLKENANISNRFPGLDDFQNSNIPIIHNMVNLRLPEQLPYNYSIEQGLKTNFFVRINQAHDGDSFEGPKPCDDQLYIFSGVYSFGSEVVKINEPFELNENRPFLTKFWKFLFNELMSKPNSVETALKGITVKQIIYQPSPEDQSHQAQQTNLVSKSKIKAVLLWEFAKVEDLKDAVTSTTRLVLPEKPLQEASYNASGPLSLSSTSAPYHNGIYGNVADPTAAQFTHSGCIPQSIEYQQSNSMLSSQFTPTTANSLATNNLAPNSASTAVTVPSSVHQPVVVPQQYQVEGDTAIPLPQINIQKKFQSLQQQQQHQQMQQLQIQQEFEHEQQKPPSFEQELDPQHNQIPMEHYIPQHLESQRIHDPQQDLQLPYYPHPQHQLFPMQNLKQPQHSYPAQQFFPPQMQQAMNMEHMMMNTDPVQDYQFGGLLYSEPNGFISDQFAQ